VGMRVGESGTLRSFRRIQFGVDFTTLFGGAHDV